MDRFTAKQLCVIFRQLILLQESQHLQEQLVQSRRVEEQTQDINWECRKEDGTLSAVTWSKNEAEHTMSFTIQPDDAVRPYVIVPDNTEKTGSNKRSKYQFLCIYRWTL